MSSPPVRNIDVRQTFVADMFTNEDAAAAYMNLDAPAVAYTTTGDLGQGTDWTRRAIMEVKDTPMTATLHADDIAAWLTNQWGTEPTSELVAWLDAHPAVWMGLHDAADVIRARVPGQYDLRLGPDVANDGLVVLACDDRTVSEMVDLVEDIDLAWTIHLPTVVREWVRVDCQFR